MAGRGNESSLFLAFLCPYDEYGMPQALSHIPNRHVFDVGQAACADPQLGAQGGCLDAQVDV